MRRWAEELSCLTPLRANPVRRPDDTSERRAVPCGLGHVRENWAFLDWVFWWYLATIELTDRILARQAAQ